MEKLTRTFAFLDGSSSSASDLNGSVGNVMMRLTILGILTSLFVLCVAALATVLTLAVIVAGMGDQAAAVVLRYIGLGIGAILIIDTVVLFLYLVFLVATTELLLKQVNEAATVPTDQADQPSSEEGSLSESEWEETTE